MARGLESKYVFNNRDGDSLTYIKRSFDTAMKKAEIHNKELVPGYTKKVVNTLGKLLKMKWIMKFYFTLTTSHRDPLPLVVSPYMVNGG